MSNIVVRSSGFVMIAGTALLGIAFAALPFTAKEPLPPVLSLLMLLGAVLLMLSLPAMYAKQAGAAGWVGRPCPA
jgi:hypothetical protein